MRFPKVRLAVKMRLLQLTFLIGSCVALFYAEAAWLLVGLLAYAFFETFAGNIGLHRYFGHRSFQTFRFVDRGLIVLSNMIGVGSTVSWVGQHAYHHKHADLESDVHSPYHQGLLHIVFGLWNVQIQRKDIQHLIADPWHLWFHKNYFLLHGIYGAILLSMSLNAFLCLYCLPNLMCLGSGYVLAIVSHGHGYRTYETEDYSTNSWLANILTLGEGWHNNHHQFPKRMRQGEKALQWDLPAYIIESFLTRSPNTPF